MAASPKPEPVIARRSFLAGSGLGAGLLLAGGVGAPARAAEAGPWARADQIVRRIRPPTFPNRDFPITRYGAVGDGRTDCTGAIRAAIRACNEAGGGRVVVPAGTFLTGAVHLRSNVNLHVVARATLLFSTDRDKYLPVVLTSWEANDCYNYSPLIYAYRQTNIAITGQGTLDGQASDRAWWPWVPKRMWGWSPGDPTQGRDSEALRAQAEAGVPVARRVYGRGHYLRPSFIEPHSCTNVLIEGVRLRRPPFWQLHPLFSRNVTIRNVTLQSRGPNDDGCDPECCEDLLMEGCRIDTRDDCIAIKSGRGRDGPRRDTPCRNVVIRGLRIGEGGGAIAIGSEQSSGVNAVFVEDVVGEDPALSTAVLIKSTAHGGGRSIQDVHMRNFRLAGVRNSVITVTLQYGQDPDDGPYRPFFRNLNFSDFACAGSTRAISLRTSRPGSITDVRLADSRFNGVRERGVARVNVPEREFDLRNVRVNGQPAHP